jgi:hypothetical protein
MNDDSLRYYMETVTVATRLFGQVTPEQIIGLHEPSSTEILDEYTESNGDTGTKTQLKKILALRTKAEHD